MFRNFTDSTSLSTFWEKTPALHLERQFPSRYPAFDYYIALGTLVIQELKNTGRCALVETMLENPNRSWDKSTILAVYDAVEYATFQKESQNLQLRYNWDELLSRKGRVNYIFSDQQRQGILICYRGIQNQWAEQHKTPQSKEPDAAQSPKSIIQNLFSGGKSAEQEAPQQQAQMILSNAHDEANAILANARKEANRILEDVQQQLLYKKGEAENEVKLLLASAQQQAEALRDQAYRDALQEAREELKAKADRDLQKMIQQNFNRYLTEQRCQWDLDHRELETAKTEMSRQTAILKEEACLFANSAGADFSMALSGAIETVSQMRSQLLEQLQNWKISLYRSEYAPLISCFNSLVTLQGRFERDMAAEDSMTEEAILTKLQQHTQSISKFRANMERAMHALGLRTFYPTQGDLFDAYYHTTDDEENDELYNGYTIRICTSPGIIRIVNSQEEVVLHRAEVGLQLPDNAASENIREVSHG